MSTQKKNVPVLRFPTFEREWEQVKIDSISKIITSGSRDWAQYYSSFGSKFIRMTNLPKWGITIVLDELKYVKLPETGSEGTRTKLEYGDILISITAELGKIGWIPKNFGISFINQHIALIRLKGSVESQFIAHQFSTTKCNVKLNRLNDSGAKSGLNLSTIRYFPIFLPSLPEQQKIALFLTVIDSRIELLTRKKTLLEQYKKGVMQMLFSQKIRFKDENGEEFPEWEEKQFEEIFERVTQKNKENNINVLTISGQQGLISQLEYFNKSVSAQDLTGYYLLEKGDFAYNKSYSNGYPMGAIKRLTRYNKGVVSTLYICFRAKAGGSIDYYDHYFNSGLLNQEIQKIAQEGARNHGLLNVSVVEFFRDISIVIPSKEEQIKIAGFLDSIDQKISAIQNQIAGVKNFKKGLLQKLFI